MAITVSNTKTFDEFTVCMVIYFFSGGATVEETDSGLFVYSKKPFWQITECIQKTSSLFCVPYFNSTTFKFDSKTSEEILSHPRVIAQAIDKL